MGRSGSANFGDGAAGSGSEYLGVDAGGSECFGVDGGGAEDEERISANGDGIAGVVSSKRGSFKDCGPLLGDENGDGGGADSANDGGAGLGSLNFGGAGGVDSTSGGISIT